MYRAALVVLAMLGCELRRPVDPANVAEQFYAATRAARVDGAPSPEQLAALAPYLSDSLHALLAAAQRLQEADMARAPDEKPAFADGDLFSSLFEGPTAVTAVSDSVRGPTHAVTLRMTYREAEPPTEWSDVVVLRTEHGRWVIDDIEYGGRWDFAPKGTLRARLESALGTP